MYISKVFKSAKEAAKYIKRFKTIDAEFLPDGSLHVFGDFDLSPEYFKGFKNEN